MEEKIEDLKKFLENTLREYDFEYIELIDLYLKKNLRQTINKSIEKHIKNEKIKEKTNHIILEFSQKYAFLTSNNTYYYLKDEEWESIHIDQIYENWCSFIKLYFNNEHLNEDDNIYIYNSRRYYFKLVKKNIKEINLLKKTPGLLLIRRVTRIFKHLGISKEELTYIYSLLGCSCLSLNEHQNIFLEYFHVWHGYKLHEILDSFKKIIGPNINLKKIKTTIPENVEFSKICCIHFPHKPQSRRSFLQGISTLPIESRMVFSHIFLNYMEKIHVGSLCIYSNPNEILESYISKTCKSNQKHIVYINEFYEDFRDYLYQKGIPKNLLTFKKFKLYVFNKIGNNGNNICYAQVAFVTKYSIFLRFCKEQNIEYNTSTDFDQNLSEMYTKYSSWISKIGDEQVTENFRIDNFSASKKNIKDFVSLIYCF